MFAFSGTSCNISEHLNLNPPETYYAPVGHTRSINPNGPVDVTFCRNLMSENGACRYVKCGCCPDNIRRTINVIINTDYISPNTTSTAKLLLNYRKKCILCRPPWSAVEPTIPLLFSYFLHLSVVERVPAVDLADAPAAVGAGGAEVALRGAAQQRALVPGGARQAAWKEGRKGVLAQGGSIS